jgi:SpoVK/Ycf46/Vps4 family AAA+-type ATPase
VHIFTHTNHDQASSDGPSIFKEKPNCGILMYGPPGCSKTLMAKALATESKFNFFAVKGPELISKYVGDTEYKIREIFRKARAAAPSVIFFDEFDAMAKRNTGHDSLSPVTALLVEMDGVEELTGVIVLAATNRPQVVDPAFLRPGRFGKVIYVGPPDLQVRKQILEINTRDRPLSHQVDTLALAERTEKWSGADIAELCNIAAKHARLEYDEDSTRDVMLPHHFDAAFKEITPHISDRMLQELKGWTVSGVDKVVL